MTERSDDNGEESLIARYFRPLAADPGAFGLIDDAAILKANGDDLVVTTDAIVEGVHFLADDPADTVARKALRVNLSDLAAKGATPAGFVMTLALRAREDAWLSAFSSALGEDAHNFACPLLGGDTVSTPGPLTISITAFGRLPAGQMVRRTGARPGDRIMVTGTIGDAAVGLNILSGGPAAAVLADDSVERAMLVARYRVPQPRNALASAVRTYATAAMDVSDGLAGDLGKLCAASGVSAIVDAHQIPLSAAAQLVLSHRVIDIGELVSGGDDYEIVCTVPEEHCAAIERAAVQAAIALTAIGVVTAGSDLPRFLDHAGTEIALARRSYSHF